jgi:hypothetical protein
MRRCVWASHAQTAGSSPGSIEATVNSMSCGFHASFRSSRTARPFVCRGGVPDMKVVPASAVCQQRAGVYGPGGVAGF